MAVANGACGCERALTVGKCCKQCSKKRSAKKNGPEDPPHLTLSGKTGIVSSRALTGKPRGCQVGRGPGDPMAESAASLPAPEPMMGFLAGKRFLITGVLSNRSIAYGIARACRREGAELAFSYVGERFRDRVAEFAAEFDSTLLFDCDVASDEQIDAMFNQLGETWPQFDGFVHSIGFAPREAIAGDFLDGLSRESFRVAHDISAYSFPAMAKAAQPMLN